MKCLAPSPTLGPLGDFSMFLKIWFDPFDRNPRIFNKTWGEDIVFTLEMASLRESNSKSVCQTVHSGQARQAGQPRRNFWRQKKIATS
jgi:hypothetical protein